MKECITKNTRGSYKKLRCVRIKDNTTFNVLGYKRASEITSVNISTIKKNLNCDDKVSKGFKFYDY